MRIRVHGHRGARAVLPANTLQAFAYAIRAGADAIELDIAVTRDDVLVVSHDPVIEGRVIRETNQPDLPPHIPTLAEVFRLAAPTSIELNLELKSYPEAPQYTPPPERFAAMLVSMIEHYGMQNRSMIQSFDYRVLREVKNPAIRRGALFAAGDDFVAQARDAGGVDYVAPQFSLITPARVQAAHAAALQVIPWTVNAPQDWLRMATAGVDAIITDDPAALIAWLEGFNAPNRTT